MEKCLRTVSSNKQRGKALNSSDGDNAQDPSEQRIGKTAPPLNCSSLASPCFLSFAFSLHFFSLLPSASYLLRLPPPARQPIRSRSSLLSFSVYLPYSSYVFKFPLQLAFLIHINLFDKPSANYYFNQLLF